MISSGEEIGLLVLCFFILERVALWNCVTNRKI